MSVVRKIENGIGEEKNAEANRDEIDGAEIDWK